MEAFRTIAKPINAGTLSSGGAVTRYRCFTIEKTSAGKHLTKVVGEAYMDLHARAAQGAFVVWIAINVPAGILKYKILKISR